MQRQEGCRVPLVREEGCCQGTAHPKAHGGGQGTLLPTQHPDELHWIRGPCSGQQGKEPRRLSASQLAPNGEFTARTP